MTNWYERPGMGWWLRLGGLALLGMSAAAVLTLYQLVHAGPVHEPTLLELLLALVGFSTASLGMVALILGRRMFDRVRVSSRWVAKPRRQQDDQHQH